MATITPANLSYKDKDGDLGEVKSLTDTDVTLLNNALQDIEDLKLAYMPGYVKRDFSNVTQDGKDAAIGWDRPDFSSGIYLPLNGHTLINYTCPSDGFIVYGTVTSTTPISYLKINNELILVNSSYSTGSNGFGSICVPVTKGDIVEAKGAGDDVHAINSLKFYPCKGAN